MAVYLELIDPLLSEIAQIANRVTIPVYIYPRDKLEDVADQCVAAILYISCERDGKLPLETARILGMSCFSLKILTIAIEPDDIPRDLKEILNALKVIGCSTSVAKTYAEGLFTCCKYIERIMHVTKPEIRNDIREGLQKTYSQWLTESIYKGVPQKALSAIDSLLR